RSSIFDNRASGPGTVGGGLYLSGSASLVENSTFSNNTSNGVAGGIYNATTLSVVNSTFVDNDSFSDGAAIYSSGSTTLANTSISESFLSNSCFPTPNFTSGGHNIENGNTCNLIGIGDQVDVDSKLDILKDVGGLSLTHVPLINSPLIDAGDDGACPPVDQRGVARAFDGDQDGTATCDIGAVEFNDFCPEDAAKIYPGVCGCGTPDADSDGDGTLNCNDQCASDPGKTAPGACGCGIADTDSNSNGLADCFANEELKQYLDTLAVHAGTLKQITSNTKKKKKKAIRAAKKAIKALIEEMGAFSLNASGASLTASDVTVLELTTDVTKKLKKAIKLNHAQFKKRKKRAQKAITNFLALLGF
ncbi:MAG: hypothetical protein KDD55_08580, partial [Bdellovibrionales bacterium]|nr:hypothetical protein [Bdellovibrionales bacterium]